MTPSIPDTFLNRAGEFLDAHPDVKDNRALVALAFMEVDRVPGRSRVGLTPRQMDALQFIERHEADTGVSPSYDEIKEALGLASKSGVHRLIHALVDRGAISLLPHRGRSIALVGRA